MELADWTRELPALRTVAIAGGLAALLGCERELAGKPAGLRTHILVGAGAALLILLGDTAMDRFAANQGAALVQSDPIRVLQAVIVGISFLGAGTIVHARGSAVEGLTTAAWACSNAGSARIPRRTRPGSRTRSPRGCNACRREAASSGTTEETQWRPERESTAADPT